MTEKRKSKKLKVVIEDVITKDPEVIEPCLVKFANGTVRDEELQGALFRNSTEKYLRLRKQRIFKVESPNLTYIGKNFGEESVSENKERLFLGILNPETNRMELVEMSSFLLHPNLEGDRTEETLVPKVTPEYNYMSEKRKLLEFGGRKGRSILKRLEDNKLHSEDMGDALNEALNKVETSEMDIEELTLQRNYDYILPPCDREAADIENVYLLENIITNDELVLFNEEAVQYLEMEEISSDMTALFRHSLVNVKLYPFSEVKKAKLVCACLYMEQLIRLFRGQDYKNKNDYLNSCPFPLKNKLKNFFMEGKKKVKSRQMQDRAICYIIVLALIINKYELQWEVLSSSLFIKKDRLVDIIKVVGATFRRDVGVIKLQFPLQKLVARGVSSKKQKKV